MVKKPFVVGNWKMNTTTGEAVKLVKEMLPELEKIPAAEVALCPPFVSLAPIHDLVSSSKISLGAQNMHYEEKGAFTGEVSAVMLKPFCSYVIIGHSERRQIFGETDDIVSMKVQKALTSDLTPILCLGETLKHRQSRQAEKTIIAQLESSLNGVHDIAEMVIAYEPIWAIGSGINAGVDEVCIIMDVIRQTIAEMYGDAVAENIRLLYGGSVNSDNAKDYLSRETINGALVGGASLKASQFISIAQQAALANY